MAPYVLHTFGPHFGLPDASPFVIKAMTILKMADLPYTELPSDVRKAPKGKLPVLVDDGTIVPDSTFIRLYLERTRGIDLDVGLTASERATGWAIERMMENHFYWLVVQERWLDDNNFRRGPIQLFDRLPRIARPLIGSLVRREIRRTLHAQGVGRHSESERMSLARGDLDSLATLLGDKPYLFGDKPHGADATLFACAASIYRTDLQPKISSLAASHANLRAYADRMMGRYSQTLLNRHHKPD